MSAFVAPGLGADYTLDVHGELRPLQGTDLKTDILIKVVVYDSKGRVMGQDDQEITSSDFYGFEVFAISVFHLPSNEISKIAIIPKKSSST
ncbi:MAG: hypothetical protein ABFD92_16495 [Planctomycetaceae bacterium]|nr:hypothetical protein [Planctomycetaceae bacterium]